MTAHALARFNARHQPGPQPVDPRNRRDVQLSGPDRIRLMLAMGRAWIRPFDRSDWSMYCDAIGEAHMVRMHDLDWRYFRQALQLDWHPEQPDLILDEGGLSWNMMDERGHAYHVVVTMDVDQWDAEPVPTEDSK